MAAVSEVWRMGVWGRGGRGSGEWEGRMGVERVVVRGGGLSQGFVVRGEGREGVGVGVGRVEGSGGGFVGSGGGDVGRGGGGVASAFPSKLGESR